MAEMNVQNKRFSLFTKKEIERKKDEAVPKNTKRANEKAGRIFRAYLLEVDGEGRYDFEHFDVHQLDEALEGFWFGARDLKGNKYRASTLDNIRHSLNRYLKSSPFSKPFDIIKDKEFRNSNDAFKAATRELKEEGLGDVSHYPEIKTHDLQSLYLRFNCSNPCELQEKVQFDIRFYFCRRGSENMHKMTKETFVVKTNPENGERYVVQAVDELTKNHQGNCRESHTGVMPEKPGNPQCPVASFVKYVQHLHPECDALWARPVVSPKSDVWYYKCPVGQTILGRFMKQLSTKYGLSQVYTNHSIRVTGATILTRNKFPASSIKAVTGHRSVSSLSIYQRVNHEEKLEMGKSLSESVNVKPSPRPRPSPTNFKPKSAHTAPSTVSTISSQELRELAFSTTANDTNIPSHSQIVQPQSELNMPSQSTMMPSTTHHSPPPSQLSLNQIDFNLSPYLKDLTDDPSFEEAALGLSITRNTSLQSGQHIVSATQQLNVNVSPHQQSRGMSVHPGGGVPVFHGCTIQNLVINVHPEKK